MRAVGFAEMAIDPLLADLQRALGPDRARAEPLELALYARDAGVARGPAPPSCASPSRADEVAAAVRVAARHDRPFVARGSGTGLAGGATPLDDPLVIVTTQLNRVLDVDADAAGRVGRAGRAQPRPQPRAVAHLGLHYAPDPSSQQACTIGGNVATNAGGPHCLASGVTSTHVLAVDVVLADGSTHDARRARARPARLRPPRLLRRAARARWASRPASRCGSCPTRPTVRTLLLDFDVDRRRRRHGQRDHRRRHRARGARDDGRRDHRARSRTSSAPAIPATPPRCCSSRSTASPAVSSAQVDDRRSGSGSAHGARTVRVAADDAERALLWKGRKSAFGAIARIAPDYYLHDAVVPRTQARRRAAPGVRDRRRAAAHDDERVPRRRRQPAPADRVRRARAGRLGAGAATPATRSSRACVAAGRRAVGRARHRAREARRDAARVLRPTTSTRRPGCATRSTRRVAPTRRRCSRAGAGAASCSGSPRARGSDDVDRPLDGVDDAARRRSPRRASVVAGRRPHALGGRRRARPRCGRGRRRPRGVVVVRPARPHGHRRRRHDRRRARRACSRSTARSARSTRAIRRATVGGVLAAGLSGHRRLRHGPLRDRVLEVRFVTADGRLVKGGGPTVKNVTGFDLPRLLVGSLGTLGVLVQVTLRCQPLAASAAVVHDRRSTRSTCGAARSGRRRIAWDGTHDARAARRASRPTSRPSARAPRLDPRRAAPGVARRARTAAASRCARRRSRRSRRRSTAPACGWLAEVGVGTVHVAADDVRRASSGAGAAAGAVGGWMLREAGAPGLDGFGCALPNARADAPHPRRVRSRAASSAAAASTSCSPAADGRTRRDCPCLTSRAPTRAVDGPGSSPRRRRRAGRRAWPAGCASRTARPTASPASRSRRRVAASPPCARSSSTARRSTTRSATRWRRACSAAAARPRARRRCRSATSWRATRAALAEHPPPVRAPGPSRRVAEWFGVPSSCSRATGCCSRSTWLAAGRAARCTSCPRRFGLPRLVGAVAARRRSCADADPRRVLFTGCVMDAWQRDVHRDALRVMRATGAPRRARRSRAATAAARSTCTPGVIDEARTPGAPGDRVDARRRRRSSSTARVRRGDEGLRPPARHPGGATRSRARVRDFSEWVAEHGAPPLRADRHARSSCRIRATSATCSTRTARSATVLAPAYELRRHRRRRPVLRRRRRLLGARSPSSRARSATARSRRIRAAAGDAPARWSSRRPTPAARCTWRRPGSTSATRPSCSPPRSTTGPNDRRSTMADVERPRRTARSDRGGAARPRLRPAARRATEDGDADALADEKKLLQARRAIERAITALGGRDTFDRLTPIATCASAAARRRAGERPLRRSISIAQAGPAVAVEAEREPRRGRRGRRRRSRPASRRSPRSRRATTMSANSRLSAASCVGVGRVRACAARVARRRSAASGSCGRSR